MPNSAHAAQAGSTETKAQRDQRMQWWREARFGMFIHWGVYSVPAGNWNGKVTGGAGEWIMNNLRIPVDTYAEYTKQFNPVKFNAETWVKTAKQAGMKYIVITSKHHEGFAMFKSSATSYNIVDATPYHHDPLKDLAKACERYGIRLGFYYSQAQDWHHAGGAASGGHWDPKQDGDMTEYIKKIAVPQVKEILSNYGKISVLWWDTPVDMTKERADLLMQPLKLQPGIIMNNRLGGGYEGDTETPEQFIPATGYPGRDWESCMTMNDTWGYKSMDYNFKSVPTLLHNLIDIASKGGNYLLNVGPKSDGTFPEESVERLKAMGDWMKINGESIYKTSPSLFDSLTWGRSTTKRLGSKTTLYFHVFDWPENGELLIPGLANKVSKVSLVQTGARLASVAAPSGLTIKVPKSAPDRISSTIKVELVGAPLIYRSPKIVTPASEFVNSIAFNWEAPEPVRFTVDGSDPTPASPLFVHPIQISASATVKAAGFVGSRQVTPIVSQRLDKVMPIPAVEVQPKPGLMLEIFKGEFNVIPNFAALQPRESKVADHLSIPATDKPEENVAQRYHGYVLVGQNEVVQFELSSDDGSKLLIDNKVVVDNDGNHTTEAKVGAIALAKGWHRIEIGWYNGAGDSSLGLKMARIGQKLQPIAPEALGH